MKINRLTMSVAVLAFAAVPEFGPPDKSLAMANTYAQRQAEVEQIASRLEKPPDPYRNP